MRTIVIVVLTSILNGASGLLYADEFKSYAPYYTVAGSHQSYLMLSNNSQIDKAVAITLFSPSGKPFQPPSIMVKGRSFQALPITDLLGRGHLADFATGHIEIAVESRSPYAVAAALLVQDTSSKTSYTVEFGQRSSDSELAGIVWKPTRSADSKVVITNIAPRSVRVEIIVKDGRRFSKRNLVLNPFGERDVVFESFAPTSNKPTAVAISHDGTPGDVIALGLVMDALTGFSTTLAFTKSTPVNVIYAVGPLIGQQLVSEGGEYRTFTSVLLMVNLDSSPAIGYGVLRYHYAGTQHESVFALTLDPLEEKTVEVPNPPEGRTRPITSAALEVRFTGRHNVIIRAFASDESGDMALELPLRSPSDAVNSAGGYPWEIGGDTTAVAIIQNTSDQPAVLRYCVYFAGGKYVPDAITVSPRSAVEININRLRIQPDVLGATLPKTVTSGQFLWYQEFPSGALVGKMLHLKPRDGIAFSACKRRVLRRYPG